MCISLSICHASITIWEHTNFGYWDVYFSGYTCDVDNNEACPNEMGWKGREINIKFNLDSDQLSWDKLKFRFNVPYKDYNETPPVILRISAGSSLSDLTVVNNSVSISYLGGYDIVIDSSAFSQGINYIQLYGMNVEHGYGKNPPNCKFNFFGLQGDGEGPAPDISDEELLDQTEAGGSKYFYDLALSNGLIKDTSSTNWASIAATGFGLSIYPIMAERHNTTKYWNYYTPEEVRNKTNRILDTLLYIQDKQNESEALYGKEGLFCHFIYANNRNANSEVSTIDTAILMAGAITAAEYFGGEVKDKVETLLSNMNWSYFYIADK